MPTCRLFVRRLAAAQTVALVVQPAAPAAHFARIDLAALTDSRAFTGSGRWQVVQGVAVDTANPKRLTSEPGKGMFLCPGSVRDLLTKRQFTDAEVHAEFLIPADSNSGIKMLGLYEIQIKDSAKVPAD